MCYPGTVVEFSASAGTKPHGRRRFNPGPARRKWNGHPVDRPHYLKTRPHTSVNGRVAPAAPKAPGSFNVFRLRYLNLRTGVCQHTTLQHHWETCKFEEGCQFQCKLEREFLFSPSA